MNAVGWQYKFIDLTTGRAKSVKVNEIGNRNSKCSWFIPDCDLVDLYWTYFSVGVDVLLIDDAHLIYEECGELGVKSKEKKESHLPSAAEGFFQEGACSIIFLPFTLSFTSSHSCKHLFQAASQVKQQKCHQSKKSQCPLEDVPLMATPFITAVRRKLISSWDGYRQADSWEQWRRQLGRGATGVSAGPRSICLLTASQRQTSGWWTPVLEAILTNLFTHQYIFLFIIAT